MGGVFHWGPLSALVVIVIIASATVAVSLDSHPYYPPNSRVSSTLMVVWCAIVLAILFAFFKAIYVGGGKLPKAWMPRNPAHHEFMQFCKFCNGFKAPRVHHCQQCGHCIKKMDHHCPWINSCVGNDNQFFFAAFVSLVPIGNIICSYILINHGLHVFLYHAGVSYLTVLHPWLFFLACGLSFAMIVAVGLIAVDQWSSLVHNMTGIEGWIVQKAATRERKDAFIFPYDLGSWRKNLAVAWLSFRRGSGIDWPTADGTDIYTLSKEQLRQKAIKRQNTKLLYIQQRSRCCGLNYGLRIFFRGPFFDDSYLSVKPGELIEVWIIRDGWAYGEKVRVMPNGPPEHIIPRQRGWFPEPCLVRLDASVPSSTAPVADDKVAAPQVDAKQHHEQPQEQPPQQPQQAAGGKKTKGKGSKKRD